MNKLEHLYPDIKMEGGGGGRTPIMNQTGIIICPCIGSALRKKKFLTKGPIFSYFPDFAEFLHMGLYLEKNYIKSVLFPEPFPNLRGGF